MKNYIVYIRKLNAPQGEMRSITVNSVSSKEEAAQKVKLDKNEEIVKIEFNPGRDF